MSQKISAMTAATAVLNADVLPIVSAGANFKVGRQLFLTDGAAAGIGMFGTGGAVIDIDTAGSCQMSASAGETASMSTAAGSSVAIVDGTGIALNTAAGEVFGLTCQGASFQIDAAGGISLQPLAGQNLFIGYTPITSGDWAGDPTSVWEALDRIAAVVSVGGATPIP